MTRGSGRRVRGLVVKIKTKGGTIFEVDEKVARIFGKIRTEMTFNGTFTRSASNQAVTRLHSPLPVHSISTCSHVHNHQQSSQNHCHCSQDSMSINHSQSNGQIVSINQSQSNGQIVSINQSQSNSRIVSTNQSQSNSQIVSSKRRNGTSRNVSGQSCGLDQCNNGSDGERNEDNSNCFVAGDESKRNEDNSNCFVAGDESKDENGASCQCWCSSRSAQAQRGSSSKAYCPRVPSDLDSNMIPLDKTRGGNSSSRSAQAQRGSSSKAYCPRIPSDLDSDVILLEKTRGGNSSSRSAQAQRGSSSKAYCPRIPSDLDSNVILLDKTRGGIFALMLRWAKHHMNDPLIGYMERQEELRLIDGGAIHTGSSLFKTPTGSGRRHCSSSSNMVSSSSSHSSNYYYPNLTNCGPNGDNTDHRLDDVPSWDARFFSKLSRSQIYEMLHACSNLHVPLLTEMLAKTVADQMKGKSVEEVREEFGIVSDYTPEEEAALKEDYERYVEKLNDGTIDEDDLDAAFRATSIDNYRSIYGKEDDERLAARGRRCCSKLCNHRSNRGN